MHENSIVVTDLGAVRWIHLNRPAALNALTLPMVQALREALCALHQAHETRVVVLRGQGAHFCAGLDLKAEKAPVTLEEATTFMEEFAALPLAIRNAPQPIIAALCGAVAGAGLALAAAADIRLCTTDTLLTSAFLRLGLSGAELGLSYLLPRLIGASASTEMLLTSRRLRAAEALDLGLVSRVVENDQLDAHSQAIANAILVGDAYAVRLTKETLAHGLQAPTLAEAIARESRNQAVCFTRRSVVEEGWRAFFEKREPRF